MPSIAIVGYTNAGKSSLLNALTGAGVLVQDALFATLEPTTRRAEFEDGRPFVLTDTVGFVRHLPTQLVEAFRSTLEEVVDADLLVHVVDGSDVNPLAQINAVRQVISEVIARPQRRAAAGAAGGQQDRRRERSDAGQASPRAAGRGRSSPRTPATGIDRLRSRMAELAAPTDIGRGRPDPLRPGRPGGPGARRWAGAAGRAQPRRAPGCGPGSRSALAASLREFAAQLTATRDQAVRRPTVRLVYVGRQSSAFAGGSAMSSAVKYQRTLFEPEHDLFRESYRAFLDRHVAPYHDEWEKAKIVDRGVWLEAGKQGFLGMAVPEEYGGGGNPDFRYNTIVTEETTARALQRHRLRPAQRHRRAVPAGAGATKSRSSAGCRSSAPARLITAIAMTEPGTGSDLQGIKTRAVKQGDHYVLNGSKTFITNGINSDLVIVVAQTDPDKGAQGFSLLVVERGMEGFERGRHLDKIGLDAQDTAELSFTDVQVPAENLLGEEGMGFIYLMQNLPQERISIAVMAAAAMESVLEQTLQYTKERKAFGKPIGSFQNSRFVLAELATEATVVRIMVDEFIAAAPGGQADGRTGRDGQVVFHREAGAFDRPLSATARRIRLHARIPRCSGLSRRSGADDLRRDDRDHEGDYRPRLRCIRASSPRLARSRRWRAGILLWCNAGVGLSRLWRDTASIRHRLGIRFRTIFDSIGQSSFARAKLCEPGNNTDQSGNAYCGRTSARRASGIREWPQFKVVSVGWEAW